MITTSCADPLLVGATCASPGGACGDLQIDGLGLAYGSTWAFRQIDLRVRACRITALVGPSGCGKSSLLSCLNRLDGLEPSARVEGRIWWQGRDLRAPQTDLITLRRRIGMIFQRPTPFPLSIAANLDIPLREHGCRNRQERADRTERALRSVGLWQEVCDRLAHSATTLSGGQQQRLCLARTLVLEPEVLLMDEPCSALDPLSAGIIEELIAGMRGFYTIVLVTHDLAQARRLADEVAVLWPGSGPSAQGGQLCALGSPAEVLCATTATDPLFARYLGQTVSV